MSFLLDIKKAFDTFIMLIKVVFTLVVLNQNILVFLIFVDGLMKEIESQVSFLPSLELSGLLFADDFV